MTRPPDFDLTTVEGIVRTVEAMTYASKVALFSTGSSVTSAAKHATEAAHHARRLQGVAAQRGLIEDMAMHGYDDGIGHYVVSQKWVDAALGPACPDCHGTGTSGERAEDGAPLVCTACQGGRR